jgi:murein DD-endopeptidase MepM/ murein hydrolase activator NlpD
MNAPSAENPPPDPLRQAIARDPQVWKNIRRARVALLCGAGALLILPFLAWDVDMESTLRPVFFRDPTPHEAHLWTLRHGASDDEALTAAWTEAAFRAIDAPLSVGSAYQEVGIFPPSVPQALGLRVRIPEWQQLRLEVAAEDEDSLRLFVDVFRAAPDTLRRPARVQSGEITIGDWTSEPHQDGDYVLRLQPELLRGGRYRVTLSIGAPWGMPVAGARRYDIGSFFGDPRDGGTRPHYGIDIFAPRGTPVVAAMDGYASMVDTTGNGGIMIWQVETGGRRSAYYAHLDRVLVQRRQGFRRGDTIGLVGNTGNARTTPPHLHFGTFVRPVGGVDPMNMLFPVPPEPSPVLTDLEVLGGEGRVIGRGASVRRSPSEEGVVLAELREGDTFLILAGTADWYRVLLPDGRTGYIPSRQIGVTTSEGRR